MSVCVHACVCMHACVYACVCDIYTGLPEVKGQGGLVPVPFCQHEVMELGHMTDRVMDHP